jgi:spore coat polysaccharide biosynthesis protein SpsF
MRTGIFVTARLGSTRLPLKHLLPTAVGPIVGVLLDRISREFGPEIAAGSVVPVITSTPEPLNDRFHEVLRPGWRLTRGSRESIPLRHLRAAEELGASHYIAVDGDDILCSVRAMRRVLESLASGESYVSTSGLPFGMNCSGYSVAFAQSALAGKENEVLETGWGRIFPGEPAKILFSEFPENPRLRFTLDYEGDYRFFQAVVAEFGQGITAATDQEIIDKVAAGKLSDINGSLADEYWANFYRQRDAEQEMARGIK